MVLGEPRSNSSSLEPSPVHFFQSSNLPISSPNLSVLLQSSNTLLFIIKVSTDKPSFPNPTITHYPSTITTITTTINSLKPNQTKPNQPIHQLTSQSSNQSINSTQSNQSTNPPIHQSANQPIHQSNHQ